MHWELWALNAGNAIGGFDTEAEALALVRQLLADGWSADDLGLGLEFDDGEDGDDETLPPVLHGAELAARAAESPFRDEHAPGVNGDTASLGRARELR